MNVSDISGADGLTDKDTQQLHEELQDTKLLYEATLEHSAAIEEQLAQKNLELQQLSEKLSLYLEPKVFAAIFSGARNVEIQAVRKKLTIFFSDIIGFTTITDSLEPEELSALLNEYLTEVTEIARRHGATVNKYIGDAVVAFFGDPETAGEREDALRCVAMAIDIQRSLVDLRKKWAARGIERPFHCRIGINTGYCTVGNFGSASRMDYTAIGGEMNLTARIQGLADKDGILVSHATWALVHDKFPMIEREPATLKGFPVPVRLYRVLDPEAGNTEQVISARGGGYAIEVDLDGLTADARAKLRKIAQQILDETAAP